MVEIASASPINAAKVATMLLEFSADPLLTNAAGRKVLQLALGSSGKGSGELCRALLSRKR